MSMLKMLSITESESALEKIWPINVPLAFCQYWAKITKIQEESSLHGMSNSDSD
jgi:hypothetical protein